MLYFLIPLGLSVGGWFLYFFWVRCERFMIAHQFTNPIFHEKTEKLKAKALKKIQKTASAQVRLQSADTLRKRSKKLRIGAYVYRIILVATPSYNAEGCLASVGFMVHIYGHHHYFSWVKAEKFTLLAPMPITSSKSNVL